MLCLLPNWSLCRINQRLSCLWQIQSSLFLICSGTFPPRSQDWKLRSMVWEITIRSRPHNTLGGSACVAAVWCPRLLSRVCRVDDVPGDCVKARGQSQVRQLVPRTGPYRLTAPSATPRCCVSHVDAEWKQQQHPSPLQPRTSVRQPGSLLTQPNSVRSEATFCPAAIDIVVTLS